MFFYPFSVKIMLKMHQKPFGGRASPGPAGELKRSPNPLVAIWGLLLMGGEGMGKGKSERGGGSELRGGGCRLQLLEGIIGPVCNAVVV